MNISRRNIRKISYKDFHIETYGCQMNVADSELISDILQKAGFNKAKNAENSGTIIFNTCSIRQHAEDKVLNHIKEVRNTTHKKGIIGLVGCMARKFNEELCKKYTLNFVVSPDSYRNLPKIICDASTAFNKTPQISTIYNSHESYSDILSNCKFEKELFYNPNSFISIARGCNNMCSYCVVPFARGKERSRNYQSILEEFKNCIEIKQSKQITLLGQNVNSYNSKTEFENINFANLLEILAAKYPEIRIRFMSPHPKDFPIILLDTISKYSNICKHIHLPLQSGSNSVLQRMKRKYKTSEFENLVNIIRQKLPNVGISTDLICGFCGETEKEFNETLEFLEKIKFDSAYTFAFSMRENTLAHKIMKDDISNDLKKARLNRMVELCNKIQQEKYKAEIGKTHLILIETISKRSSIELKGFTDNGKRCVIPNKINNENIKIGDFIAVKIEGVRGKTLRGIPLYKSSVQKFYSSNKKCE